ncbi:MAG: ferritin-like domain-containing protein [Micrococcales bacterium]|nr:ferritin-like domain-containing protein [Micrococcales bacterium]MCL2667999.1 ferritin-like domain-containing protein [Micrococcales bacterium]
MTNFFARATVVAVCCAALVGCGLRLETPDPAPVTPGVSEHARARAVADATALADAASALSATADEAVAPVLDDIATFCAAHVEALGETYDPSATPTTTPTGVATTPTDLLDQLATATSTAGAATDVVDDGDLARVLGSVTTSRGELTVRLAQALGVAVPKTAPAARDRDDPVDTLPSVAGPLKRFGVQASALVLAHDQAGYAFEVIAAQAPASSELRTTAVESAEHHRAQAATWARASGVDGTGDDPRRAQYQLPANLSDAATASTLAVDLERAVAQGAAAALAGSDPGARADILSDLRTASAAATTWGGTPQPLPGLA